jgi:hypothetical protein
METPRRRDRRGHATGAGGGDTMSGPALPYERPAQRGELPPLWPAIVGVVLVALAIAFVVYPRRTGGRINYNHVACAGNLKQIGQAMRLYANENGGAMTPDFARLIETQDLVPECFVCRSTNDVKSTATDPAVLRADLAPGAGHCSYVFAGATGRFDVLPPDDVVAFEPPGHHVDKCSAVLFADGRVERVTDAAATDLVRQFDHGLRPIRAPVVGATR